MADKWMSQALERLQSASRTIRLTLPPNEHELFWERFISIARVKTRGLSIILQLPKFSQEVEPVVTALKALKEIETTGHEVSWVAVDPLPFNLFIMDDQWALIICGDPDSQDNSCYVRLTENNDESKQLRDAFDLRSNQGTWGIDLDEWEEWLGKVGHAKDTAKAIGSIKRGDKKLQRIVYRKLKHISKRNFWIVKPRYSAYGQFSMESSTLWFEWLKKGCISIGWPDLAKEFLKEKIFSDKELAKSALEKLDIKNQDRVLSVGRCFVNEMKQHDRFIVMDGWSSRQETPVRFYGWGRLEDGVLIDETEDTSWPLIRPARIQRYEIDLPINAVRAVTGLNSATYPIHNIKGYLFRNMVDLSEEVIRSVGQSQMELELTLMDRISGQQELL